MKSPDTSKYSWDLENLLEGATLQKLYQKWLDKQKQIINLYPAFDKNLSNFKKWLKEEETYEIISNRLCNYVNNNYEENQKDSKWIAWSQKISNDSNKFNVLLSDFSRRVVNNKKQINEYLKANSISEHQRRFNLIFQTEPHILPENEQKILSTIGIINSGFATIFSTLKDTEIKFKDAVTSKNKKIPLETITDIMKCLNHKDRSVRKSTWINFNKAHHNYENTFTQTLYYNYLMLNTVSKIHKFKDYVDATAFQDEIDKKFINNLYKNTEIYKTSFQKYRKIFNEYLKKQLNLTSLEPWDKTVQLSKKDIKFTIEQTKQIILGALQPLGDEYINVVKEAFNKRWISWLSKPGKQQGAYSIDGTKGLLKYYISMNFDNTIRSVSTIAHELGHSLNSYFINKKQKIYTSVSIFYAEISSIVNEMLLSYYLLDHYSDAELKKLVLDEMINNFFATVTRQIIFSNTEYILNEFVNNSQPLTKDSVKDVYHQMINKYQGIDNEMEQKWKKEPYLYSLSTILRIPHFYAGNFYVYKYAVGQIVAILVADKLYHRDADMLNRYFNFLSSGSSRSPIDTIKLLGVDLNDSSIYQEVKKIIDQWILKFSSLK